MEFNIIQKLLLLERMSVNQLTSNTNIFFDTPRKANSTNVQVTDVNLIPSVDSKTLLVKAKTRSKNSTYETKIFFTDVKFVQPGSLNSVEFMAVDGQKYAVKSLKRGQSDCKVSCTCPDFYYMFSVWNDDKEALEGPTPEPYIKKTDSPPRNPQRVPGVCKHLMKLADTVVSRRILK